MQRISSKLVLVACLWLTLTASSAFSVQAAPDIGAIVDPSDVYLTELITLECPKPAAVPYGITPECAHALSMQATRMQTLRDYERAAAMQTEAMPQAVMFVR